jgi:hypothetical protein
MLRATSDVPAAGGGSVEPPARKEGYLLKKGKSRNAWKRRYFVLDAPNLAYWDAKPKNASEERDRLGCAVLTGDATVQVDERENMIALSSYDDDERAKDKEFRKFFFKAGNHSELQQWVTVRRTVPCCAAAVRVWL